MTNTQYELTILNMLYYLNASTCTTTTQGTSKPLLTHCCAVWWMCDRGFLGIHTLEGTLCGSRASSLDLCSLAVSKPSGTAGLRLLVTPEGMLQLVRRYE